MKQHSIYLTAVMSALVLSATSCSVLKRHSDDWTRNTTYMIPEHKEIQLTAEQQQYVTKNNTFGCRLFSEVVNGKPKESAIVSPLSVTYLLGMLNAGAEGTTRQEITDVMGFGDDRDALNTFCKKMLKEAPFADSGVTVEVANALHVNSGQGIKLQRAYENTVTDCYEASVEALDFGKDSSKKMINSWCSKHTHGMIPSIIDKLDAGTLMVALNAIYFKATWNEPFDPKDTRQADFTLPDGRKVKRQLMHRHAYAQYSQNEDFAMLCLPYGDKGYCMYVLLPQIGKTTGDIIRQLDEERIRKALRQQYKAEVDILLPAFTTESDTELNDVLKKMGMPTAFAPRADFSRISNAPLYIGSMKQKAKIEVNEEGTKASAVTVAEMLLGSAAGPSLQPQKVDFHADRPFVYLIREMSTGALFFLGQYLGEGN